MTATDASLRTIDVDALRVGMFVHLDVRWTSHPFARGRFRINSHEQIAAIRSLGLRQVQWSPARSDRVAEDRHHEVAAAGPGEGRQSPDRVAQALAPANKDGNGNQGTPSQPPHRPELQVLQAQRAELATCEKQFARAAQQCMELTALAPLQPVAAGQRAETLAQHLVAQMAGKQDLCIRLLTQTAGNKAGLHAMNVVVISLLMGRTLGLADEEMNDLGVGAMLHDVGKLDLPDRVRHREERFTAPEQRLYEEHVQRGVAFAQKMGLSAGATTIIAQHHEHADGSGFPLRLTAERIGLASSIVALVNRYDNLCNPHVAARALTPHESISLLFAQGQAKFQTSILTSFIRMMGVYPAGSVVQLTDDRFALVMGVNSSRPLKPRVLVYDAGVAREEAVIVDLEATRGLGIRRSLNPSQLPRNACQFLAPPPHVAYFFESRLPASKVA